MSEQSPDTPETVPPQEKPSWARNLTKRFVMLVLLGATAFSLLMLGVYSNLNPSTDDAFVFGNVVGVTCRVEGPVIAVHIRDNQEVKKGDLLMEIDPSTFQVAVNQAAAEVQRTEASAINAKAFADRVRVMAKNNFMSANQLDDAEAAQLEAEAALAAARAALAEAQLNLSYTKIYATVNGVVTNFRISPGVYIFAGQPVFALIDMDSYYVGAFFRENIVRRILPNQLARVTLNMYPGKVFYGRVEGVGWGTYEPDGSSVNLLPDIKPTVDWVRLAMRFQVRINMDGMDPEFPLRLGSRAVVTVDTLNRVEGDTPYNVEPTIWDWLPNLNP